MTNLEQESPILEAQETKKPVRRGRPRKTDSTKEVKTNTLATSEAEQNFHALEEKKVQNEVPSAPKRKTRKKAEPEQDISAPLPLETKQEEKPAPKKRGRKPKALAETQTQQNILEENKDITIPSSLEASPSKVNISEQAQQSPLEKNDELIHSPLIQLLPTQKTTPSHKRGMKAKVEASDVQIEQKQGRVNTQKSPNKNPSKKTALPSVNEELDSYQPIPSHQSLQNASQKREAKPRKYSNQNKQAFVPNPIQQYPNSYPQGQNRTQNQSRLPKNRINKDFQTPAFDNSSIIAAITGKNLTGPGGSMQDYDYQPQPNPNSFSKKNYQHRNLPQTDFDSIINMHVTQNLRQQAPRQNQRQSGTKRNLKSAHMQEQVMQDSTLLAMHENAQKNSSQQIEHLPKVRNYKNSHDTTYRGSELPKLPFFAEQVLEHGKDTLPSMLKTKTPAFSPIEEEIPKVEPKKRGRKKKAETVSEPLPYDYLQEKSASTMHREHLKMFVSTQADEQVEVVLTENGTVVEYFVEMAHQAKIRGNIYKGVVHNVDPNLQAAFINFGANKNGFLQIDEIHPDYYLTPHTSTKNHKFPLISKVLKPGQEVLVQIVKEPTTTKGAFLTTWISLAGRYLVLTPGQEQLGVSRKVVDPEERARLRAMLDDIEAPQGMGFIIRTAAATASLKDLQADVEYLQKLWFDIVNRASESQPPALVHQEIELTKRVVRDYLNEDVREIWVDDKEMASSINEMTSLLYPQRVSIVRLHSTHKQNLWDRFSLQKQINEISQREIHLPSGGRVIFDQTEALMAIDINSGKTQNKANFQAMVLQTNIEAARAIARHLRLRDIGGQIVIDFIEVRDKSTTKEIEKAFKDGMKPDRARYEVENISPFGLLEVIRQRIGSSAISISTEPCPHCNGTGTRRNMEWQAQDALKEIARKARLEKTIKYTYTAEKELALYLLNHKRDRIIELEEELNVRIEILCIK